jgi:hypothetical protein
MPAREILAQRENLVGDGERYFDAREIDSMIFDQTLDLPQSNQVAL